MSQRLVGFIVAPVKATPEWGPQMPSRSPRGGPRARSPVGNPEGGLTVQQQLERWHAYLRKRVRCEILPILG
eukprot:3347018-Pyramimonas_sp.AAC.1